MIDNQRLSKAELLECVLAAVQIGGWDLRRVRRSHPFGLTLLSQDDRREINLRVYVWNCVWAGKNHPENQFRVRIAGKAPKLHENEIVVTLGWHDGYGVFIGFDGARPSSDGMEFPGLDPDYIAESRRVRGWQG